MDLESAGVQETRRLYEACYPQGEYQPNAVLAMLGKLAEILDRSLSPTIVRGYQASLAGLSREELVMAFTRSQLEMGVLPAPAALLRLSGRRAHSVDDEDQAPRELTKLFMFIRDGFRGLKTYRPRIEHPETKQMVDGPPRTPRLDERQRLAIALMGFGAYDVGVDLLRAHSAIAGRDENSARVDRDIEIKWQRAWRESVNPYWLQFQAGE